MVSFFLVVISCAVAEGFSVRGGQPTTIVAHQPVNASHDEIVYHSSKRQWWGFPNYDKELDRDQLKTWPQFARDHGHLGSSCTIETATKTCGTTYVCKFGACVPCAISRDCNEHFRCEFDLVEGRNMCIPRDLVSQWHWREVACTILIILTAMLSAAAGMGGGGVYVPLCLLLLGLSIKEAIPLSQAMILGGAIINIMMFCGDRHPLYPHKSKIDYDVVMMLNPGLAVGVTIGVICHMVTPQWITVLVLVVTLVLTLQKSLTKGVQAWQKESKMLAQQSASGGGSGGGLPGQHQRIQIKTPDIKSFGDLARNGLRPLGLIAGCWAVFLLVNMMKAPACSAGYWLQVVGMIAISVAFTFAGSKSLDGQVSDVSDATKVEDGVIVWTPKTLWLYPLLTTVAGFLGGFLGIGGGMILGPLLLELGMHPEANQATTAMFVFLSSSLATIQFIMLGKGMPQYVVWFTSWVVVATLVGQTGIDYLLKKYKRTSPIVLSVAAIVAGSLVMMTIIGTMDVVHDLQRGADMGFSVHHLCHG